MSGERDSGFGISAFRREAVIPVIAGGIIEASASRCGAIEGPLSGAAYFTIKVGGAVDGDIIDSEIMSSVESKIAVSTGKYCGIGIILNRAVASHIHSSDIGIVRLEIRRGIGWLLPFRSRRHGSFRKHGIGRAFENKSCLGVVIRGKLCILLKREIAGYRGGSC